MRKNLDFSGQDLQGHSFRDQSLTGADFKAANIGGTDFSGAILKGADFTHAKIQGADFSNADIQSANFTKAILIGARFNNAKAGSQKRWVFILLFVSLLLSVLSGLLSTVTGAWSGYLLSMALSEQVAGLIIIASSLLFITIIFDQGLQAVPKALGTAGAIVGILSIVGAIAGNITLPMSAMGGSAGIVFATGVGIITVTLALAVSTSTAIFVVWAGAVAGGMALGLAVSMALIVTVSGAMTLKILAGIGSFSIALPVGGMSAYIGYQALAGNQKYAFLRELAVAFATIGGTSFYAANLTDADFTLAILKGTDFRKANLTRTCWHCAKLLDRARPGKTYLQNAQVRQLLTTRQGPGQNFDRQNLRGINLQKANITDASFMGADLSEATLQNADLARAKLMQTQLDDTDLTGATLTGAYIQDWGITRTTNLNEIKCEYVYMRIPTQENPDPIRKPDNRNESFEDGDFADFIRPLTDTLDLYHNQDVDPRAIALSFKCLAENNPEAGLEIVAMEKKGRDKFLLRAKTSVIADKSELSAEYFATYNDYKSLAPAQMQALLAEKDSRITQLANMLDTAIHSPKFTHVGDVTVTEAPKKSSTFNLQGAQFGGGLVDAETVNAEQIGGNITNINQEQNLAEAASEIQRLLKVLEQNNPAATDADKEAFVTAAIAPSLKKRAVKALQSGGEKALEKFLENPYIDVAVATVKGWQGKE